MHAYYARGLQASSRCDPGIASIQDAREKCRIRHVVGTCICRVLCVSLYTLHSCRQLNYKIKTLENIYVRNLSFIKNRNLIKFTRREKYSQVLDRSELASPSLVNEIKNFPIYVPWVMVIFIFLKRFV